jgi:hypothetical protein
VKVPQLLTLKLRRMQEVLTITATPNHSKRTFTIRKYYNGKLFVKYRTVQMGLVEFDETEMNTFQDWKDFLKGDDYYVVSNNCHHSVCR